MSQRIDHLKELIRYGTKLTVEIPELVFIGGSFIAQRKAYDQLKKDKELDIQETTIEYWVSENEVNATRIINITLKKEE